MPRWEPGARERLEDAALDLFSSQGYDATTVAAIADRAGVTSRTFFRHFADKREALFGGADGIRDRLVEGVRESPAGGPPLEMCLSAMRGCEDLFHRREHNYLRRREAVLDGADELREREGRKLRWMADDLSSELTRRGVSRDEAVLVADVALVVFVHASRLWMREPDEPFSAMVDRAAAAVAAVAGASR